jgi:hypothetical protein
MTHQDDHVTAVRRLLADVVNEERPEEVLIRRQGYVGQTDYSIRLQPKPLADPLRCLTGAGELGAKDSDLLGGQGEVDE